MRLRLHSRGSLKVARRMAAFILGCALLAGITRLAAADLEEVLAAKLLRVGLTARDVPPLVQTGTNSAPTGLEGDFIAEVARRMDVKLAFVRTARTPAELIAQVASSQVDISIGQLTDSLEWAKSVRFSRPYIQLQEVCLAERLAATRAGGVIQLLAHKTSRVTSVAGSVVLPAVQEEFGDRLTVRPSLQSAVEMILAGQAVAVVSDDVAVSRWLAANPAAGLRLQLLPRPDRLPGLAMAVNWKSDDLQAWLNLCIEKCVLDGTLSSLASKYLGDKRPRTIK